MARGAHCVQIDEEPENGVRMALGAAPFVRVGLNVWASRFVATLFYRSESRDPVTLVPGWDSGC